MNNKERYEAIFAQFDRSVKDFCDEIGGLYYEITPIYKGAEKPENLDTRIAGIYGSSYVIFFRYTAHAFTRAQHSILDCAIRFGKDETEHSVPLPFLVDFCGEDIAEPLCIPFITSDTGMTQAFSVIGDVVKRLMPRITAIADDEAQKREIGQYFREEFALFTGSTDVEKFPDDYFLCFLTGRFSYTAYTLAIKGKTDKAVKALRKIKKRCRYENRMLDLWQAGKTPDRDRIPEIVSNMEWVDDRGMSGIGFSELLCVILSCIVMTVPASAVYLAIYFLLILFQQQNSFYLTGIMGNMPYCILAGFLTGIAVSYFTHSWFTRLLFRKKAEKLAARDQIDNSGDRLMKFFTRLVVIGSVVFIVFVATCNLNFKSDGFIDNTGFFSVIGTYYGYGEIECVRYIPDRVNGYGETIDYPSYALVLKNGKVIDLHEYASLQDYDPKLIDFLREKGIRIEKEEMP